MRFILIIFLLINSFSLVFSQNLDGGAYASDGLFVFGITGSKPTPSMRIQGSQYYDEEFKLSYLKYFNKRMDKQGYMRYNAFVDEIEIADSQISKTSDTALLKDKDLSPVISGETFIYIPYRLKDGRAVIGYLIEKFKGRNYTLYERRRKNFMEEVKARTSLENSFPPRYINSIDFYISVNGSTPVIINKRRKDFLTFFSPSQSTINSFIKDNKLKINNLESLIEIFQFAESLK